MTVFFFFFFVSIGEDAGEVESLVTEWDQEGSLGVETSDNVGGVGENVSLLGSAGVFFGCGRMIWAGHCCFVAVDFMFLNCFFPLCDRIFAVSPMILN